ncbi:MAG: molecular chaperone HtpG [Alphaproteobacteria bacterium]|nr:molecular chaperone HtpG [Alphaproteobacteria bacterium]
MEPQKHVFQAEVSRLLDIVAHSLYSEKQIFLRELISNASDACDRLRYAALTQPDLVAADPACKIAIGIDKGQRTLTISDNGIGMSRDDLVENLGTIARSGTAAFMQQLSGDQRKDMSLIGQFGVGFYSAFMVADKVEVLSCKAGDDKAWLWTSDGKGEYTVTAAEKAGRGTLITLHLRENEDEFLEATRLKHIIKTYSDHIAVPITVTGADGKEETANAASALWTRAKNEITADQYKEFYHHVGHSFDDPWLTVHYQAEGTIAYSALVFVPTAKPFDLFHPERKNRLKLYVKRVFITESVENLVPAWLRFLKGVVDSDDLPLNISREMLQHNPVLAKIKAGLTKRVLADLVKKAEGDNAEYAKFWENFGAALKEGLYEPNEHRDQLLTLVRAHSTGADGLVSLAEYIGGMKEGQDAIYYITGESLEAARASPQLEGFKAKGIDVLLLVDPIDEFWIPAVEKFDGKEFKSATRGGVDLSKIKPAEPDKKDGDAKGEADDKKKDEPVNVTALTALLKLTLGDAVKDVRSSERLTDSAVCLIADDGDMDMRLERLLRQHKQLNAGLKRVLEINPRHELIQNLSALIAAEGASGAHKGLIEDAAFLLLDQARIMEGEPVPDPRAFARRMASVMAKGLSQ